MKTATPIEWFIITVIVLILGSIVYNALGKVSSTKSERCVYIKD